MPLDELDELDEPELPFEPLFVEDPDEPVDADEPDTDLPGKKLAIFTLSEH
ncbi:hypothetical protein SAMN04487970_102068 [Paenibacillus tianmuensis]|uniref:Uncharacterized protein n=1 Tax=Paenibacillus tianmuensis TaxID=624147 RepID=A0A1G4RXC4_9BACL|nr:hypothetical protein [Paenibacillus tianmuensis]SCW61377.1 hypothetical protein SAMN04487970_102068 [Paenibacillus tianmuensis]